MKKEGKDPYRIRIPVIWEEIENIKSRLEKLESKNELYDEFWEIKTLGELDNLTVSVRKELEKYGRVSVSVEKHDE